MNTAWFTFFSWGQGTLNCAPWGQGTPMPGCIRHWNWKSRKTSQNQHRVWSPTENATNFSHQQICLPPFLYAKNLNAQREEWQPPCPILCDKNEANCQTKKGKKTTEPNRSIEKASKPCGQQQRKRFKPNWPNYEKIVWQHRANSVAMGAAASLPVLLIYFAHSPTFFVSVLSSLLVGIHAPMFKIPS